MTRIPKGRPARNSGCFRYVFVCFFVALKVNAPRAANIVAAYRGRIMIKKENAMLRITEIKKEDMPVSNWSGGSTTEIMIFPKGARYADREFLFRISTAQVELESSDFTSLPDYLRVIASLEGELELTHTLRCGELKKRIIPLETVHYFDGSLPTHCVGRARDLNLMLKKGAADGELRFVEDGEWVAQSLNANEFALVYSIESGNARFAEADEDDVLVFASEGRTALFTVKLTDF